MRVILNESLFVHSFLSLFFKTFQVHRDLQVLNIYAPLDTILQSNKWKWSGFNDKFLSVCFKKLSK